MKFIYALWGDGLGADLRAPELRQALRTAGATRLQLNIDDDDVAAAMLRITTFDTPVRAVVSVWTDGDAQPISELLARHCDRLAGWEVEERTPLVPPSVADGDRVPALSQFAFLRIPDSLTRAEWLQRWQGQHTQVAIDTQDTFGYVQNRVLRTVFGPDLAAGAPVAAIVEELFPMAALTDLHAFYGSGGDDAELQRRMQLMIESVMRFGAHENLDSVPTSRYCFQLR